MKAVLITPAMREAACTEAESTPIQELPGTGASFALRLQDNGRLRATRVENGIENIAAAGSSGDIVALLRHCCNLRDSAWVFVACASNVALNGLAPPLAVAVIEPGMLLAIGERHWLVSSLWRPEAVQAPDELRDKPCPVCGGELGLAPVVQCGCGRWTHLENASAPHDKDALNCFTAAGTCGGCGRRASLEPQMFPEVSELLAGRLADADEFDWR